MRKYKSKRDRFPPPPPPDEKPKLKLRAGYQKIKKPDPRKHLYSPTTAVLIRNLHINGNTIAEICEAADISTATLRRYYAKELAVAKNKTGAGLGAKMIDEAAHGNVDALKFTLERKFGWLKKTQVELSGSVGSYDISKLTEEEARELDRLLTKAGPDLDPDGNASASDEAGAGEAEA